jgi:DNA-directed RNA polymerase beta subunit
MIKDIIEFEEKQNLSRSEDESNIKNQEQNVLSHLGEYIEEPYNIIESYFGSQHLDRLVRHQIESYNHFINFQIQRTIQMFNPVIIRSENDFVIEHKQYFLEILKISNYILHKFMKITEPQRSCCHKKPN